MTSFPGSPRLIAGGIVLIDPETAKVERVINLQYNPDTVTRTLQIQGITGEATDQLDQLRLKGPPIETYKVEAELDASDQLEFPDENPSALEHGLQPVLAALETIVYPSSSTLQANAALARSGAMEIYPLQSALHLFVWSKSRVLPVRITEFSITEEAFDPKLNPIRAKVSLGMRVLNVNDVGFDTKAGGLFMIHQQQKEKLAKLAKGALSTLGLRGIP
jgi:hypothetical protein